MRTKGRFPTTFPTSAGVWMKDRAWKQQANPQAWEAEQAFQKAQDRMMEKKKKQKILQNIALEQQYKIHVKKPKQF